MTLRSWCQMNRNSHSSPVKHKVYGKPNKILKKLKVTSGKSTFFGHFLVKYFMSPVFTSVFHLIRMILPLHFTHIWLCVDLIFALQVDIWWFCFFWGSCQSGLRHNRIKNTNSKIKHIQMPCLVQTEALFDEDIGISLQEWASV